MNADHRWMDYAIRLGARALGTTAENPPVGCVIVKDGRVLGVGWTQAGGRPHAETEALAMAGAEARGATAYVTLEPCAHHGRTPPCAAALAGAGVARVVASLDDPDPRVNGGGFAILRAAGVTVETGLLQEEARMSLAGFLTRTVKGRPQVILKLAVSADGKIAAGKGRRTAITGERAQACVHLLRAGCDAILVGMDTVLTDDPELTCRLPGLSHRSPKPFVMSRSRDLPPRSKLAARVATVVTGSPPEIAAHLGKEGINRLLVEGGGQIARAFLASGLVDEFHLYRAPAPLGPGGIDALAGLPLADALQAFKLREQETLGPDTLSVYEVSN